MKTVAAIMPTRGRQEYARLAVESFLAQDYPSKSLVIVDDADDPSFPDGFPPDVQYRSIYRAVMPTRLSIGRKRNTACELAHHAEIIAHFDSDDWSAPDRLSSQVALLESSKKAVVGFNRLLFYESETGRVACWQGSPHDVPGGTMAYRRDWWNTHRFKEDSPKNIAEDNHFRNMAYDEKELATEQGIGLIVARAHPGNTATKNLAAFPAYAAELPTGFPRV